MTETQLRYATQRIVELESLRLADVTETVWPAEVGLVFGQIENAGDLPAQHRQQISSKTGDTWFKTQDYGSIFYNFFCLDILNITDSITVFLKDI